jgi:hypothetical protein
MNQHHHGQTAACLSICLAVLGCDPESDAGSGGECAYTNLNGDSYGCGGSPPCVQDVKPEVRLDVVQADCTLEKTDEHPHDVTCSGETETLHWHKSTVKIRVTLVGDGWEELPDGVDAAVDLLSWTTWGPDGEGFPEIHEDCGDWDYVGHQYNGGTVCHFQAGMPRQTTIVTGDYGLDAFCANELPEFKGHAGQLYTVAVGSISPSYLNPVGPACEQIEVYEVVDDAFACP